MNFQDYAVFAKSLDAFYLVPNYQFGSRLLAGEIVCITFPFFDRHCITDRNGLAVNNHIGSLQRRGNENVHIIGQRSGSKAKILSGLNRRRLMVNNRRYLIVFCQSLKVRCRNIEVR